MGLAMIKNSISTVKEMLNVVANPSIINIAKVGKAAYGIYMVKVQNKQLKKKLVLNFNKE